MSDGLNGLEKTHIFWTYRLKLLKSTAITVATTKFYPQEYVNKFSKEVMTDM